MGVRDLLIIHPTNFINEKQVCTGLYSVSVRKQRERNGTKAKEKYNYDIKIADVESHFSKGVSFRELGTNFWPWLSSKFSVFAKIKSEFSRWHWNFLLPIHDLSGVAGVTHDETLTI